MTAAAASTTDSGRSSAVPADVLKILEVVVAPLTALTALMYFFGLLHTYWFLQTFGVEYTVMGFTTNDYLFRSVDGLFVPLAAAAAVGLAVRWAYGPLAARMPPAGRQVVGRYVPHVALVVGLLLAALAATAVLRPQTWYGFIGLPGVALALGVVSISVAVRAYRRRSHPQDGADRRIHTTSFWEWAAVFLLVNVGLFWAVADYSGSVGSGRGQDVVNALPAWPDVVLFSDRDLNLPASEVTETVCGEAESAYRYRYDGLKLIVQSGGQYLFLPETWSPERGQAVVLPRTDTLRLDFAIAGRARDGSC